MPVNKMKYNQVLLNENENVSRTSLFMLIPCLTGNDIISQNLGTNVMSAVITGLICREREVAVTAGEPFPLDPLREYKGTHECHGSVLL